MTGRDPGGPPKPPGPPAPDGPNCGGPLGKPNPPRPPPPCSSGRGSGCLSERPGPAGRLRGCSSSTASDADTDAVNSPPATQIREEFIMVSFKETFVRRLREFAMQLNRQGTSPVVCSNSSVLVPNRICRLRCRIDSALPSAAGRKPFNC